MVLAATVGVVLLAGCDTAGTAQSEDATAQSSTVQEEEEVGAAEFGHTATTPSGISVTVRIPTDVDLSSALVGDAYDLGSGTPVSVVVIVKNNTEQSLDAIRFLNVMHSGGEAAQEIVIPAAGLPPVTGTIEPSGTLSYTVGYLVKETSDMEFTWSDPYFDEEELTFYSAE